jgi:hypothetical protein
LKRQHKNYIFKLANGKFSGKDNASIRKITQKVNRKFKLKISKFPVQTYLKQAFNKPKRAGKTFYKNPRDKISRKNFAKWIIDNDITGDKIFFTDEKTFCLNGPLNPQINQIRLSKKDKLRLKAGDEKLLEKVNIPQKKFPDSFMVAGGLCKNGVSKLMFCIGTIQSWAYKRAVDYYKEDSDRLGGGHYFMYDGATCHKPAKNQIKQLFGEDKIIENWPANSPGKYDFINFRHKPYRGLMGNSPGKGLREGL